MSRKTTLLAWVAVAWAICLPLGFMVFMIVDMATPDARSPFTDRIDRGPDLQQRWLELQRLLACQRGYLRALSSPILGETVHDPRTGDNHGEWIYTLGERGCRDRLAVAIADRRLPAEARAALTGWQAAVEELRPVAYELGDYYFYNQAYAPSRSFAQDDLATGRARWPELRRRVAAVLVALAEAARVANPAIRADLQGALAYDRDVDRASPGYRRAQLHVALIELDELVFAAPLDRARLGAAAARLRELATAAPPDERLAVQPALDALDALGAETATAIDVGSLDAPLLQALWDLEPIYYPPAQLR